MRRALLAILLLSAAAAYAQTVEVIDQRPTIDIVQESVSVDLTPPAPSIDVSPDAVTVDVEQEVVTVELQAVGARGPAGTAEIKTTAGDPTCIAGTIVVNTADDNVKICAGGAWRELASW